MDAKRYSDSLFRLKARPIVDEHVNTANSIVSNAASRGFSFLPGYAFESLVLLELATKLRLDEANFAVIQDSVDRHLRALGLEQDNKIRMAQLEFELRKANLFALLSNESADLSRRVALADFDFARAWADIELRNMALDIAQRDLSIEVEKLRQKSIDSQYSVLPEERKLIDAEVATAQSKLAIIPVIRRLIDAERAIITYEEEINVPALQVQLEKELELVDAQQLLIAPTIELASATLEYARKQPDIIPYIRQKAASRAELASQQITLTPDLIAAAQAELSANTRLIDALPARSRKAVARLNYATNMYALADAELRQADKRLEYAIEQGRMISPLIEKAGEMTNLSLRQRDLITALIAEVEDKRKIAIEKAEYAQYRVESLEAEIVSILKELDLQSMQNLVTAARTEYMVAQKESDISRAATEIAKLNELMAANDSTSVVKERNISLFLSSDGMTRKHIVLEKLRGRITAAKSLVDAERQYHLTYARDRSEESGKRAEMAATAEITGQLLHVIS